MNWYAAVREKTQKMGIGVVICDSMGEVLACLSSPNPLYSKLIVAEFGALWISLKFGSELGFRAIQFEGMLSC